MRYETLLAIRIGYGFEAAVLGVRGAGLEGHHPALASGHHHGVGEFEALLVQAVEDLEADAGAPVGADLLPIEHGRLAGVDQCIDVAHRVADTQVDAVGRLLAAMPAGQARLVQRELLAEVGCEGILAVIGSGFAIGLGARHLVVGGPVAAGGDGVQGAVERGAVLFEQGVGHVFLRRMLAGSDPGGSCLIVALPIISSLVTRMYHFAPLVYKILNNVTNFTNIK